MKKVLFVATIFKHFRAFHIPYMQWFKDHGWNVELAAGGDDIDFNFVDQKYRIDIQRSPFSLQNIKSICQLEKIINDNKYDLVYCHTAMGAVVSRLAAKKARKNGKTKVIYVAHGFHFFKGSPKKYWWMYYPMEKFLSRYTDAIVTINKEDFDLVKRNKFKNNKSFLIPGIGVDTTRFYVPTDDEKNKLRNNNGIDSNSFVLLYVAEFIHRKNHKFIIDSVPQLISHIPNLKIIFAGRGILMNKMIEYSYKLGVTEYVDFLGFRDDIPDLIALSDLGISASRQEGLPLNLIEEMLGGLPVVATKDRGHSEIIAHEQNGFIFEQNDRESFVEKISWLYTHTFERLQMGEKAHFSAQKFAIENSIKAMEVIFHEIVPINTNL